MSRLNFVLAVDDESANNLLMKIFFTEDLGLTCNFHSVLDVEAGIALLSQLEETQNAFPELILLDVNMPGKGGFDFLRLYQQKGFETSHPDTSVVLFSSSISPEIEQQSLLFPSVLGIQEKSLDSNDLKTMLLEHFSLD